MKIKETKVPTIREQNIAFNKLSTSDKRKAIARDVILQIKTNKFLANRRSYIRFVGEGSPKKYNSMQEFLLSEDDSQCSVCAMGAVLMSKARLGNVCGINDTDDDDIIDNLKYIFSARQLRLMEAAFEGGSHHTSTLSAQSPANRRAIEFFTKYTHAEERMLAIMNNVIDNNGIFKP